MCSVMKLDLQRDEWTKLPQDNAMFFAMASLTSQLVLVGGYDPMTQRQTNKIAVYDNRNWCHHYPPTSSVEVLDLTLREWYTVESLHHLQYELKSTSAGNTFYLIGRRDRYFEFIQPT